MAQGQRTKLVLLGLVVGALVLLGPSTLASDDGRHGDPVVTMPPDDGPVDDPDRSMAASIAPAAAGGGDHSAEGATTAAAAVPGGAREDATAPSVRRFESTRDAADAIGRIPQCAPLGATFATAAGEWVQQQQQQTASLDRLVYNCESNKKGRLCGGMGDRFRGMIATAWIALVAGKRFVLNHPVPVPIQRYLAPHFFDWTPTAAGLHAEGLEGIPLNTQLMRLNQHGKFFRSYADTKGDLRVQSNSFGVDGYMQRVPKYKQRVVKDLGLSTGCNVSCYFGCMHAMLFQATPPLRRNVARVFERLGGADGSGAVTWDAATASFSTSRPYVGVQIRMGGPWAPGLRVAEPWRTPPDAIPHFFAIIKRLRKAGALKDAPVFITSDSQRLVNMTRDRFGATNVLVVPGNSFTHTDSSHLHGINDAKWKPLDPRAVEADYLATLTNHFVLAHSAHVVMAQSGFGDTAFWRTRRSADCIFSDMNRLSVAWQHRLSYRDGGAATAAGGCAAAPCGAPAVATHNRIINVKKTPDEAVEE